VSTQPDVTAIREIVREEIGKANAEMVASLRQGRNSSHTVNPSLHSHGHSHGHPFDITHQHICAEVH